MTVLKGLLASLAMLSCGATAAAEIYGSVTTPPGVYFGSGNPNGNFNINRTSALELALRAKNRSGPPLIDGSSGVYQVEKGFCQGCGGGPKARWNYEFSIHTVDGQDALANYVFRLGVDHDASAGTAFTYVDPLSYWSDNALDGDDGAQASQNVRFADTPGGAFDVFAPGLYDFVLLAYARDDTSMSTALASVDMTVQVVPEPGSLALLGAGILAFATLRRRQSAGR